MLSFKDFLVVNYTPGMPELISLQAKKRKRDDTTGPIATGEEADAPTKEMPKKPEGEFDASEEQGDDEKEEEDLSEVLSMTQRQKARQRMRRIKSRLKVGRRRAMRRMATAKTLKRRASRAARAQVVRQILKGKSKGKLSLGARANLERQVNRRAAIIKRQAVRLLPMIRARDRSKGRRKK